MRTLRIGDRVVGRGRPTFVIAEIGVNHNGDLDMARRMIEVAAAAGVDAVKFQTFRAEALATPGAAKAPYQIRTTGAGESQLDMLKRLELAPEAHTELQSFCREQGVLFLSTPFDDGSLDLLHALAVPAYKISSGDLTNLPFLERVARCGKPVIVSTGMGCLGEVEDAVDAVRRGGDPGLVLLQCVSNYPADPADTNLRAMRTLDRAFGVPVGYSDHTPGLEVSLAAVALGACMLEKHFTLDRTLPGPDHAASLEPTELAALVRGVRTVESALGSGHKVPAANEQSTAEVARKSLVLTRDVRAGESLDRDTIGIKRPGTGLSPALLHLVVGRRLSSDQSAGALITLAMLS